MNRSSKHSAMQLCEIFFAGNELHLEAHIDYTFHPAVPATAPSYASGGDPPEGARVEIDKIEFLVEGAPVELPRWLRAFIEDNLNHDELVEEAVDEIEAEKDEVAERRYEAMRDDRLNPMR